MVTYRWEMGLTRAEFLRCLPVAVDGATWREEGERLLGEGWRVTVVQKPPRRFSLIALPVLDVVLEVDREAGEATEFVRRFLLGFQRAGG